MKLRYKLLLVSLWFSFLLPAGTQMNLFVMSKNGGKMPVMVDNNVYKVNYDGKHQAMTKDTQYKILCDIIHVRFLMEVVSIGDILIFLGFGSLPLTIMILFVNILLAFSNWPYRSTE